MIKKYDDENFGKKNKIDFDKLKIHNNNIDFNQKKKQSDNRKFEKDTKKNELNNVEKIEKKIVSIPGKKADIINTNKNEKKSAAFNFLNSLDK